MVVIYILIIICADIIITHYIAKQLWRYEHNKRAFIALNIWGIPCLVSGIIIPYGYLLGVGIGNLLWSILLTDWYEIKHTLYRMHFNENKKLSAFISEMRLERPGSIYHPLFSNQAPYAYIKEVKEDSVIIKRFRDKDYSEITMKELYDELAEYKLKFQGASITGDGGRV